MLAVDGLRPSSPLVERDQKATKPHKKCSICNNGTPVAAGARFADEFHNGHGVFRHFQPLKNDQWQCKSGWHVSADGRCRGTRNEAGDSYPNPSERLHWQTSSPADHLRVCVYCAPTSERLHCQTSSPANHLKVCVCIVCQYPRQSSQAEAQDTQRLLIRNG